MTTIVDSTPHFTPDPSVLAGARDKAKAIREATKADRMTLEGGALVYRDSPPGIGYVLVLPNGHKKYYVYRYQAVAFWMDHYRLGKTCYFDPGVNPKTGTYSDEDQADRYAEDSLRRKTIR